MVTPLAIVMPVYNEIGCIERVVREWIEPARAAHGLLLLVDNGSTDGTMGVLEQLREEFFPTVRIVIALDRGHGHAIRCGYEFALRNLGATWVAQVDSDNQFSPADFARLLGARGAAAAVISGVRLDRHDRWPRLAITSALRLAIRLGFGLDVPDANCPYRLMHGAWLRDALALVPTDAFAPNIYLSVLAARNPRARLTSVPVTHRARTTGAVTIDRRLASVCARNALELLRFRRSLGRAP